METLVIGETPSMPQAFAADEKVAAASPTKVTSPLLLRSNKPAQPALDAVHRESDNVIQHLFERFPHVFFAPIKAGVSATATALKDIDPRAALRMLDEIVGAPRQARKRKILHAATLKHAATLVQAVQRGNSARQLRRQKESRRNLKYVGVYGGLMLGILAILIELRMRFTSTIRL